MSSSQDKIYTYFERDAELRVLFIFNDPFLCEELSSLTWEDGYEFVVFKGDWFTTKYKLDHEWKDKKIVLYMSMFSPLKNKKMQENFPLMDVLTANMEYHHQDYAAFMQQYGIPQKMAVFVEKNIMQLQSEKMMHLLLPYYQDGSINQDLASRAFLSSFLHQQRILEWDDIIIRILLQGRKAEEKKQTEFFQKLKGAKLVKDALYNKVESIFGVTLEENTSSKVSKVIQILKYNIITQNLALVDADNYKSYRITDAIALQQINRILELAMSQPKSAAAFLETINELGTDIHDEDIIRWYGTDANYYFLPDQLCLPIVKTLMKDNIAEEPQKVIERIEDLMIKHSDNSDLALVMDYAVMVARYYEKSLSLGSLTLNTPDDYVNRYQADYYQLDQLYRLSLETFYQIPPTSQLFDTCQEVKGKLDSEYAKWTNRLNLEFTHCIQETGSLKNLHGLKQQDFYQSFIQPIQKKVVVIVSDALRYELAQSLVQELAKSKHVAKLTSAIAMLPTETKFCKPALFPHKTMTLYDAGDEQKMRIDNKVLDTLAKRNDHLKGYKEKAACVTFEEVAQFNIDKNREIFKNSLVYIFHNSIDEIGHNGTGKQVVNECAQSIKDLATLIAKIHSSYNVTEVYVTADHGFIFNDMEIADKDKQKVTEDFVERKTRYYLTTSKEEATNIVKYPLQDVSGINEAEGIYVAVPEGTNRLAAPSGGYNFTHGGASLQELVIPIIISRQERQDVKQPVGVIVLDRKLSIISSRLRCKLLQTEAVNMDNKERIITVGLYVNDKPVTAIKQITLDKTDELLDARKIPVDLTLTSNVEAKVLQLKVYDIEDDMNPIIKANVTNNTLIENDFDF